MFLAAFASLRDPASRAFYDRKRAEGRRHNAAVICLARRRCDVILAMLRSSTPSGGEARSRRGNHRLKNAMFLAAFASLRDPASRAFYDRKRAEGGHVPQGGVEAKVPHDQPVAA